MQLNYLIVAFISFIPLIIGFVWYRPNSFFMKSWGQQTAFHDPASFSFVKIIIAYLLSFTIVFGYMNLVIHQMGFYELFFTDIMKGSEEAKRIADEFLQEYGRKHRSFGHGAFHGLINAVVFALPFIGFCALLEKNQNNHIKLHFSYWVVTSFIIGGLISAFV